MHPKLTGSSLALLCSYYIYLVQFINPFIHSKNVKPSLCTKQRSKRWEYYKHGADILTKGDRTELINYVISQSEDNEQAYKLCEGEAILDRVVKDHQGAFDRLLNEMKEQLI